MRITVQESPAQVFRLSTPMHLLDKLWWEIAGFKRAQRSESQFKYLLPAYHAFNCAVTAWHMTDWVWEYADAESRVALASKYKIKGTSLRSFQKAVARANRSINACQEIANGSKHREVRRLQANPHVRAEVVWAELEKGDVGERRFGSVWQIRDEDGVRPALQVFKEAADYWREVISPWMEDSFVEGRPIQNTRIPR